jgi:NitT/TauT family transport system permease protein
MERAMDQAALGAEQPAARRWSSRLVAAAHRAVGLLPGLALLVFWQWASGRLIKEIYVSKPTAVAARLYELFSSGEIYPHLWTTGQELLLGYAIGVAGGVIGGYALGRSPRLARIFEPYVMAFYGVPKIALAPLFIIWFGIGMWSKVFIVFLSAFFPILVNTVAGIRNMDRDLLRAARAFCASDWQIFKTLAIPGSVPFILTGVRQGVAVGLIGVVVGEMLGSSEGVGFMVAYGGQTFQTDTLFVGFVIIALAGILLTSLAERLERRFSRWRPER